MHPAPGNRVRATAQPLPTKPFPCVQFEDRSSDAVACENIYPIPSIIRKLDDKKNSCSRECQVMITDHLTPYEYGVDCVDHGKHEYEVRFVARVV